MAVGAILGSLYATVLIQVWQGPLSTPVAAVVTIVVGLGAGCVAGYVVAPSLTIRPYRWATAALAVTPFGELVGGLVGGGAGLGVAALVAVVFVGLPYGLGWLVALATATMAVPIGVTVGRSRRRDLAALGLDGAPVAEPGAGGPRAVLVDTSALVDGRLLTCARAGLWLYPLVVPRFVVAELQDLADSASAARRSRGRRGLEQLAALRELAGVRVELLDQDFPAIDQVDLRLVRLARERRTALCTVDYNLEQVALVEGLAVVNLNRLAAALRAPVQPGEIVTVEIQDQGREPDQGLGYLDDGTMVLVDGSAHMLGAQVHAVVRSVRQTATGRMVFARLAPEERGAAAGGSLPAGA
ncbi:MAG TPA: TRAM domain-containing protein [Verrucomicrobiae bacterium]|nr:TRAM domain-containing protein [Verrucomicrobiae bacterium]